MGTAIGVGLGVAISKAADFNQAMSFVDAATHETASNMSLLRQAALDAGASTVFSATESANAIEELGKAGLSTSDILSGGLAGSLDLAAAGGLGVAEAAGYAATALKQFGLNGADTSHVADLLAAGAGKAMGDVSDLSQALNQAGLVANSSGLSIEETTGALSAFASKGLLGSDAGTSFKTMLQNLTPQSAKAKEKMDELGVSAYDASGHFVGLSQFAGNLRQSMLDLTPEARSAAMSIIFGSDSVRAANVLYEEGSVGIQNWIDKVNDQGYAADTARRRLDNLKGDVEQLGGALDTALISTGSQANDALRVLAQAGTSLVDNFNAMPEPLQAVGLGIGVVAAAGTLAGGAFFSLTPKIADFKSTVEGMGPGVQRASRILGAFAKGLAIGAAVSAASAALEAIQGQLDKTAGVGDKLNNTLSTSSKDTKRLLEEAFGTKTWQQYGADLDTVTQKFGDFIDQTSQAPDTRWLGGLNGVLGLDPDADRARDQFDELGMQLAEIAKSDAPKAQATMRALREEYNLSDEQLTKYINLMGPYKSALTEQATAAGLSADDQTLLRIALQGTGQASAEAGAGLEHVTSVAGMTSEQIQGLIDSIKDYGSATTDIINANSDLYQSIDDAKEAFADEKFVNTLDLTSQAGRDNTKALLGIAEAGNAAAAQTYQNSMNLDELTGKLNEGRQALYDQARQFFDTDEAAWHYVDTLMKTPDQVQTQVQLNGVNEAQAQIDAFVAQYQGKTITMQMFLESSGGDAGLAASAARYTAQAQQYYSENPNANANGGLYAYANGGIATGIYAGRAGAIHKFAEPETGWEAYISGRPGQESRNRGIWAETGRRLGVMQTAPESYASIGSSGAAGRSLTVNQVIQPSPGMSDRQIADAAARRANWEAKVHG